MIKTNNLVLDYIKSLNKRIVFLSEHGSFLYKLNGPNSDIDYKGIFIPKYNELIFDPTAKVVKYSTSDFINKNDENDIDLEIYSLQLSLYKYLIEKNTSIKLGESYLIWMSHNNDNYKIIKTKDRTEYIEKILKK